MRNTGIASLPITGVAVCHFRLFRPQCNYPKVLGALFYFTQLENEFDSLVDLQLLHGQGYVNLDGVVA